MKFVTSSKLLNYITANIPEADIFAKYLSISITDVYKCINDRSYRISNPLREDKRPSLGFLYVTVKNKSKLYAKDFANPFYTGDCFQFVGITLGLHCNIPEDFIKICRHILNTFDLLELPTTSIAYEREEVVMEESITKIDIENRKLTLADTHYWKLYGVTPEYLDKEFIFPVNKFFINDILQDYYHETHNPCYAYYLGFNNGHLWELYRPIEAKASKFRTNDRSDIKELYRVSNKNNLILTKSKKDKTLIVKLLNEIGIIDTDVLYCSESIRLRNSTRHTLEQNYRNIYVNFDVDIAGINGMKFFNKKYGYKILPFIIENIGSIDNYPKDISDFCKSFGYANTLKMFEYLYKLYMI